ncbi:HAD family hydrolase [Mycolicibacterium komossense]|uniref:HAD hydrolase-like protein n=1 Tax=Mycolicibacterium komossense TaxID=1779 RepID=A0ABT3CF86_9MYCO|nr:HAD family hydrolase [Mycolicibacterium komossense]MCV7228140.1 HAD hydrolase-like protein [Mycolicibacterium komossense]
MADRWLTFDCYGTIIDWRTGMTEALDSVAPGRSVELIDAYYRCEPEVEAEPPFRNYRAILTEGLRRTAEKSGIRLRDNRFSILADTLPSWPAFADSLPALQQLRDAGYKLGILTNTDADLFAGTVAGPLPFTFDEVITAEEVQSYKPGDGMFDEFLTRHDPAPANWIHIGNSVWHDCEPAHRRGFRTVFVHRSDNAESNEWIHLSSGEQNSVTATIADLASLPATVQELA